MEKRDVMSPARKRKLEQVQRAIASREGGSRDRAADDPHHHKKTRSPPPKLVPPGESTGSTNRLLKLLDDKGPVGAVTRRVMEATTNYRPEREMAKTARVFETTELSYNVFRANLTKLYALTFSDDEFSYVKTVFDEHGDGKINGYHFMVAFTQLASIRKEREAAEVRKKEEAAARRREHEEEVRRLEAEKKMQVAADYKFTPQVQERALTKLAHAAKAFDPSHPNAPNLDGYAAAVFNAGELREMLRAVFALTLSRQELGAIMAQYGGEHNTVPAGHFIREFIKLGLDGRNKAHEEQRKLQAAMDKQAEDDKAKKAAELEAKRADTIDYDFSELDEARAVEKMREAAFRYDRTHPSAQGLDGFECEALAPGLFRDLLRRTFNLALADKEIAVLVRKFDRKRTGKVACAPFVTEFLRLGQVQRQAARVDQLKRQAAMNAAHEAEQLEKAREAEGKNPAQQALKVSYDYVEGAFVVFPALSHVHCMLLICYPPSDHLHAAPPTASSGHGIRDGQAHRRGQKVRQGPRQRAHVVRAVRPQLHDVRGRLGQDLQPHVHAQRNGPPRHAVRPQENPRNRVQAVFDGVFPAGDDGT